MTPSPDAEDYSGRVTSSVHIVTDGLDNMAELMTAAMPSSEPILKIRKKTVCFCELIQSLEDDFFSDLTEKRKETDWPLRILILG